MRRLRLPGLLAISVLILAACSDELQQAPADEWELEEIFYERIDAGAAPTQDVGEGADPGVNPPQAQADAGSDGGGLGADTGGATDAGSAVDAEPPPSGTGCQTPEEITQPSGSCDPVQPKCDGSEMHCELVISGSPPPIPICRPVDPDEDVLEEGEPCHGISCVPGHICREGYCRRYCHTASGLGCEADDFCRPLWPGSRWGTCAESC